MLYVKKIPHKGRGVFTNKDILAEECVEISHVLVIPSSQIEALMNTELSEYLYHEFDEDRAALAFGNGSLINHSYDPNTIFVYNPTEKTIDYFALRDIKAHEEILINYNGSPEDKTPVWFEVS